MTNGSAIQPAKILIIEDDKFISRAYSDGISRAGFQVTAVLDGVEALEKAREVKPDLVLLDLILPGKNGFQILTEFKNDPELKEIPVIVLSNLSQPSDIDKAKSLGAVDYLTKVNFSMKEVVEKLKSYLATSP